MPKRRKNIKQDFKENLPEVKHLHILKRVRVRREDGGEKKSEGDASI